MPVYDKEDKKATPTPTSAEQKEAAALESNNPSSDSSNSPWDTNLSKKDKLRFKFRKKQALIGSGTAGIIIGISLMISSFLSGPAMIIQIASLFQKHFSDIEELSDTRTGKLIKWARTRNEPHRRNLSYLGNKLGNHYDKKLAARGMTARHDGFARIRGIDIDISTPEGKKSLEKMRASGFDIPDPPNGSTVTTLDLSAESARTRRGAISAMTHALDINGVSTSIASRTLKIRGGVDFHPLKNIAKAADEDLREYIKKRKDERAKKIQDGSTPETRVANSREDDPENPASDEDRAKAAEVDAGNEEIQRTARDPNLTTEQKVSRVRGALGKGVGATAVVGLLCGLDALGDASHELQASNIELPSIRTAMDIISVASQIQSGNDVNMDEVGAIYEDLYDEKSKTSVFDAESIQHGLGNENTGQKIPESAKPGKEKPAFFRTIDTITDAPGVSHLCGIVNSTLGGIALAVGGIALSVSGPISLLVSVGSEAAQNVALGAVMDDVVRWLAGDALDAAGLVGATLGSVGDSGAFMAANNECQVFGCTALSDGDRRALLREQQLQEKREMKHKSWYARIVDPYEPNSLIASAIIKNPEFIDTQRTLASFAKAPLKAFSSLVKSLGSVIPGVSAATTEPFDYGVDKFGYTLDELDNGAENPYENAERFENNPELLERMNRDYGEACFGATIDPDTGVLTYTQAPSYIKLEDNKEKCTDRNNSDLTAYRFYLADKAAITAMACYEGIDEEACAEIGIEGSPAQTTTSNASIQKYQPSLPTTGEKITPQGITLHWWGGRSNGKGIDSLAETLRERNLGVQFGITADGNIYQLTPNEDDKVNHASGANSTTFGIEIEGLPEDFGATGPTTNRKKFDAVVQLVKYLVQKYNISTEAISSDSIVCGNISGIHPHKAYNKCGGSKIDIDDAYFNAVMTEVRK